MIYATALILCYPQVQTSQMYVSRPIFECRIHRSLHAINPADADSHSFDFVPLLRVLRLTYSLLLSVM